MTIRRPSRKRRIAKWTGLSACVVIVGSMLVSARWMVQYTRLLHKSQWGLSLGGGRFEFGGVEYFGSEDSVVRLIESIRKFGKLEAGWKVSTIRSTRWILTRRFWRLPSTSTTTGTFRLNNPGATPCSQSSFRFTLPCWFPFVIVAAPTAILWHRDRRTVKPRHCLHCGYNLTGNQSGFCPECATPVTGHEKVTT